MDTSFSECPVYEGEEEVEFIDFWDLFLNASSTLAAGASGLIPYGDLTSVGANLVKDFWTGVDKDTSFICVTGRYSER